ncbi:unnamed protein product [Closterium sp. NIES-53]
MRNPAVKRILQEVKEMQREGSKEYTSMPLEEDIFEWQFAIHGPKDSEFEGGIYHGRITLPADYPFKPPSFMLLTPSGRFEVQTKICLSISNHHPEHWQPSWSVRTALVALIAFMPTKPDGALGSLDYPKDERRKLAIKSRLAPPKFGSPGRQQVIDQIHTAMLQTAPPIPASLQSASSPSPKAPDAPQATPTESALSPAAESLSAGAAADSGPSPASPLVLPSSTDASTEQPSLSSLVPLPAAAQPGDTPSTSSTPAVAGSSSGSAGVNETGTGHAISSGPDSTGAGSSAPLLQASVPAVFSESASAGQAVPAGAAVDAAAIAGASVAAAEHSLTEPLLPPSPLTMIEPRQPSAAAAVGLSAMEARAGTAGVVAEQSQNQAQATRAAEGRGRVGGAAGEDRVLNTLAAAIVVAIVALLLRKFLRVYSPLDETSMEW